MTDQRPETNQNPSTDPEQNQATERGSQRSQRPSSAAFREFIAEGWDEVDGGLPAQNESASFARERRAKVGARFPGERLVIPAGELKVRNNDCDYRFRPHSAFAHLTGTGTDFEPDAVLVLHPKDNENDDVVQAGDAQAGDAQVAGADASATHEAVLYFRPRAGKDTEEFYADARYGELWVGQRPSLEEVEAATGIKTAHIDTLGDDLAKDVGQGQVSVRVVPESAPLAEAQVAQVLQQGGLESVRATNDELAETLAEIRLTKDAWEVDQMRLAVDTTIEGFADIVRNLERAIDHHRGERVVEGAFSARAREAGNGVGYDVIAASGNHANTLHWIGNDGPVRPGDLILVDAGVEVDSLYTADITRTLPVDGTFTEPQARVYQAVLDAADAAFAKAGQIQDGQRVRFRDVHAAAMEVIAARLEEWGLLPTTAAESLSPEGQYHRRWMVHGTSHHLGIDVHDCAQARREMYVDAFLEPGMIFTIEPGLYFREDDLKVPAELRGIGVRIEDDILVTDDGVENLSAALPREIKEIEAWMAELRGK